MRGFVLLLFLLFSGPGSALEIVAVLGCPREDGTVTALSYLLRERVASQELSHPEARRVDSATVARVLSGLKLRGGEELKASLVLKLGSYLEAGRLVASTYRLDASRCVVRWRVYETLTGSLERVDSLVILMDSALLQLDGAIQEMAPVLLTDSVLKKTAATGPRIGRGKPPLVLDGCRFGERGARCRGRLHSRGGGEFRLLRDGSRFAYDNGLRGSLGSWTLDGKADPVLLEADALAILEFEVGITLAHSGPREFHFFQLRYQFGDELWEWRGIPSVLPGH